MLRRAIVRVPTAPTAPEAVPSAARQTLQRRGFGSGSRMASCPPGHSGQIARQESNMVALLMIGSLGFYIATQYEDMWE